MSGAAAEAGPLGMDPASDAAGACQEWRADPDAHGESGAAAGLFRFDRALPVFAGHFPGHPLVPGVHLLAAVARLVALARPATSASPIMIERVRWTRPVRPQEPCTVTVRWRQADGALIVDGAIAAAGAPAMQARLRYAA